MCVQWSMEYQYIMALNSCAVVLPRAHISDAVQDGCQRLLTRNVINLGVKFSKLKNFKAPKAENGCADACNRPPNLVLSPCPPRVLSPRPPRIHGTLRGKGDLPAAPLSSSHPICKFRVRVRAPRTAQIYKHSLHNDDICALLNLRNPCVDGRHGGTSRVLVIVCRTPDGMNPHGSNAITSK